MIKSDKGKLQLCGSSPIIMSEFVHIVLGIKDSLSEHDVDPEEITRMLTGAFFAGMTHDTLEEIMKEDENEET